MLILTGRFTNSMPSLAQPCARDWHQCLNPLLILGWCEKCREWCKQMSSQETMTVVWWYYDSIISISLESCTNGGFDSAWDCHPTVDFPSPSGVYESELTCPSRCLLCLFWREICWKKLIWNPKFGKNTWFPVDFPSTALCPWHQCSACSALLRALEAAARHLGGGVVGAIHDHQNAGGFNMFQPWKIVVSLDPRNENNKFKDSKHQPDDGWPNWSQFMVGQFPLLSVTQTESKITNCSRNGMKSPYIIHHHSTSSNAASNLYIGHRPTNATSS